MLSFDNVRILSQQIVKIKHFLKTILPEGKDAL